MATTTEPEAASSAFSLDEQKQSVGQVLRDTVMGPRGELGARPALAGLIALIVLFSLAADRFASKANFANLITQATWVMILAMA